MERGEVGRVRFYWQWKGSIYEMRPKLIQPWDYRFLYVASLTCFSILQIDVAETFYQKHNLL